MAVISKKPSARHTSRSRNLQIAEMDDTALIYPGRKRAPKACVKCRRRKVRCDVTRTGNPCTNCRLDSKQCEVIPRAKTRQVSFPSSAPALADKLSCPDIASTRRCLENPPTIHEPQKVAIMPKAPWRRKR